MKKTNNIVQKSIAEEAIEWAAEEIGSRAKTEAGRKKAVEDYTAKNGIKGIGYSYEGNTIAERYENRLYKIAKDEMDSFFSELENIKKERKELKKYPDYTRFLVSKMGEVQKTYKNKAGILLDGWANNILQNIAFGDIFSSSRYRKIYKGNNCLSPGMRTDTNGKYGWDEVVWHYADYTAIINPAKNKIAYRTDKSDNFEIFSIIRNKMMVRGKVYSSPIIPKKITLKPHTLRRYYTIAIPQYSSITWVWDREEKAGYYMHNGEKYHTPQNPTGTTQARKYFYEAVEAFRKRRNERIEKSKEDKIFANLDKIFVEIEDSINAGNCKVSTNEWSEKMKNQVGATGECAIRADLIWNLRNDSYARRAILQASKHHKII